MGVPHRCRKCGTRHTFKLRHDQYYRRKRCKVCGALDDFRVDQWMLKRDTKKDTCWGHMGVCLYPFPHRKGSRFCFFNPSPPPDWEWEEFYRSIGKRSY